MVRQRDLIAATRSYSVANVMTGKLPRISIGAQATYQSEVTQIPVEMPGIEPLAKDQYRVFGEVTQTVFDGGTTAARKQLEEASADVDEHALEKELYQLRGRVNDLFFGILLFEDQIAQTRLAREDLEVALRRLEAAIRFGTALPSDADVIRAELLHFDQRIVEMASSARAYRDMLGLLIGAAVDDDTVIERPVFAQFDQTIARPELAWFQAQMRAIDRREEVLASTKNPRVELFIQGGYGRPGLNMLENQFDLYYLGGVRINWLLSGFYTFRKERRILDLQREKINVQKEAFLFNTGLSLKQHDAEINRLRRLIEIDADIISLRSRIRQTAGVQLEQGVISPTDFVREVNAEQQARQNQILHQTQLLLAQAKYLFATGQ